MADNTERMLGEANGKLDTLLTLMRDHIAADERKFAQIDDELASHAKDINQAKGAKAAILLFAGGVAAVISAAAGAAMKLFGH